MVYKIRIRINLLIQQLRFTICKDQSAIFWNIGKSPSFVFKSKCLVIKKNKNNFDTQNVTRFHQHYRFIFAMRNKIIIFN